LSDNELLSRIAVVGLKPQKMGRFQGYMGRGLCTESTWKKIKKNKKSLA